MASDSGSCVELIAFDLTNKLAFALIHDHGWSRVALPHVALPPTPERFRMEGMRGLPAGSANIAVARSPWSAGSPAHASRLSREGITPYNFLPSWGIVGLA